MKMKLTVKSLLFYWLFSIVSLKLHGAVKFGYSQPNSFRNVRNIPNLNVFHHKTANDMRAHIKKVLNMHVNNSTIDKYISLIFNINNVNPTYVFQLPDNRNQTLVLRKSDFTAAVFPNITNVNKFKKPADNLEMSSSIKHPVAVKSEETIDELRHEMNIFDNNINNYDDYDDTMKQIVDENVRSEKEFIKLMNEMNEDLNEEDLRQSRHQKLVQSPPKKPKQKELEEDQWEELGLRGWSGTVTVTKDQLPRREKPKRPKKLSTALTPLYSNFELGLVKTSSQNFEKNKDRYKSEEDEIEMDELADQLSAILLKDEQTLLNKTGRQPNQKPRWPITTTRDKHGDNDVFLARANNPFGHSTKWKYNNNSDIEPHREGRSKRGVYHLYSMIKCATGCDPLVYKGYGCFCGFLGAGKALDGIDRCCKAHDYCYTSANCIFYTEYFVPYLWKCYRGKPLCAIENGEWGGINSCASKLCQCDLALSKCLRHYYCPKKRPVCVSSPFRLLQNLVMVF